jgi:hypothetical protein
MKKRNLLRASGILVILAVLGLLSACDNFIPYEPGLKGGRLILDKYTISDGDPVRVTVVISSKKNESYYLLKWGHNEAGDASDITVTIDKACSSGGTPTIVTSPADVPETTTYIFTLSDTSTSYEDLFIEVLKDDDYDPIDYCEVTIY